MPLPNVIVAGAQKSGTTTLCLFLDSHPHCLLSEPKEPNFFSRAENVAHLAKYERCFRRASAPHRVLVDGTTSYMADPAVAPRIRGSLGDEVKIIFVLRKPSARAYSSFLHMLKRGHERRTADEVFLGLSDDPAAAAEQERSTLEQAAASGRVASRPYRHLYDDVLWNYRYVGNSLYSSLVESYTATFKRSNILVLYFEEVTRDISLARETLGAFLGVDPALFPDTLGRFNSTRVPDVSNSVEWLIEQARWIKRGNWNLVRPSEIMASPLRPTAAVQAKLENIFASEVAYWSRYSGRDLETIGW